MQRRNFFKGTSLTILGSQLIPDFLFASNKKQSGGKGTAKNIIFLVSDGMSTGTLNMANLLLERKEGRTSNWIKLYQEQKGTRGLMDTASANSLVTDSAAASSSWGGGVRVNNGSLNVSADGTEHKPILQKFKAAGKSVGCVTTVQITHATPAGFCINSDSRGDQASIANKYLPLKFDVMMGGGLEFFSKEKRKDGEDVFGKFAEAGYKIVRDRAQMLSVAESDTAPLLGVFSTDGLPYSLDRANDDSLQTTPTLAEMAKMAIAKLSTNKNGFVLQIEGGKVDWAAHSNDAGALLYDQLAFDDAIKVAIDFAEADKNTLVIITTDHGNSNPGLFSGAKTNDNFDRLQHFKHTNNWILNGINHNFSPAQVIERIEAAQGIVIKPEEAAHLLKNYEKPNEQGIYNPYKLPFKELALIQAAHTSIGFGSMDHSADYVEVAMFGPGSSRLKPFVKNTDLHNLMLDAAGVGR